MKKYITYFIVLLPLFFINTSQCRGEMEKHEGFFPIETCTLGVSIDDFLKEFKLQSVNKIVFQFMVDESTPKTLKVLTKKEKIGSIISSLNNIKCTDITLSACVHEIWLYENDILHLKVALCLQRDYAIARFYRPEHIQYVNDALGERDFFIDNKKLCSWLNNLANQYNEKPEHKE